MNRIFRSLVVPVLSVTMVAQVSPAPRAGVTKPKVKVTMEDIQSLREALAAQQQMLEELRAELQKRDQTLQEVRQQAEQALSNATAAQEQSTVSKGAAKEEKQTVAQLQSDVVTVRNSVAQTAKKEQARVSALENVLGRFRFSGDVRLRGEGIMQRYSGCATCDQRFRERLRLRLGVEGQLNEDFRGGIYLASGILTDPISTNETLTNFFERKTVGFDRGWITYQPQAHKWLQLTGGKFAYTWLRSSLTFDPDLNPEGGSEKLSLEFKNPVIKNVSVTGIELLFNEIAKRGTFSSASFLAGSTPLPKPVALTGHDSYAVGGQVSTTIQVGNWLTTTPALTALNWQNTNSIVQSISALNSPSGNLPITNATINESVVVGGKTIAVPVGYQSRFLYADAILDSIIKTPSERFPFHLLLDYEQNTRAASRNRHGYWVESAFGRLSEKHDVQFGYTWGRIEQDAVIGVFNESELRASTNILQNRILFAYQAQKNVTLQFTDWIGRTLNSNLQNAQLAPGLKPGMQDSYVKRLQFDLLYKF